MNTKTPRDESGKFQSWNTNVQTGYDSGRNTGRGEGAIALAAATLVAVGLKYAFDKIREKWF